MASVTTLPDGKRRVQFVAPGRARRTIHLGKVEQRYAESVRLRVEAILGAQLRGEPIDRETSAWLGSIDDWLHIKLAAVGLVKGRQCRTLGEWMDLFMESRAGLKPESRRKLEQTRAKLESFFGRDRPLQHITAEDASRWRDGLARSGLSEAACKSHTGNAKTVFRAAVERELLLKSPFSHLKGGVTPSRNNRYVTPEEIEAVIAAAPDAEWRLLLGLARYAGLRTPSETSLLTWADIDWDGCVMRVRSPKTERHPGHEQRIVPIVPRLMELLERRRAECPKGEQRLVTIRSAGGRRRKMVAVMEAAGVEPWDDTWQTLRHSCEIQWMNEGHAAYVVCRWLGHTLSVSARHYTIAIPDEVLARVTGRKVTQKVTLHASAPERTALQIA
ncbi:MAG: tyrosine-type recombinase/integrase [Phycisphaeraceae bacterium]|nr:tyrosine-type recombinase/integrase [Phycisphaeraceae bacterium]